MREDYLQGDGEGLKADEREFEKALRPLSFSDFTGQHKVVDNIKVFVQAAKQRGEPLDHVLLHGPPGLGKTTLSHIIANELESNIKIRRALCWISPATWPACLRTSKRVTCSLSTRYTASTRSWKNTCIRPWKISGSTLCSTRALMHGRCRSALTRLRLLAQPHVPVCLPRPCVR